MSVLGPWTQSIKYLGSKGCMGLILQEYIGLRRENGQEHENDEFRVRGIWGAG